MDTKIKKVFVTYQVPGAGLSRPYLIWRCNKNQEKAARVAATLRERGYTDIEIHIIRTLDSVDTQKQINYNINKEVVMNTNKEFNWLDRVINPDFEKRIELLEQNNPKTFRFLIEKLEEATEGAFGNLEEVCEEVKNIYEGVSIDYETFLYMLWKEISIKFFGGK